VPSVAPSSDGASRIADQLKRSLADDLIGQYLVRLQSDLGVSINETALRQVVGAEN
jgi:peptidyl-prolyl cis-trans isomerase D